MKYDYKNLPPFKWFILQNFPFIEADFDAITNWQLFCKLGEEINKVIQSLNLTGEQVENLTNAFNNLETYVNNYFENLDVQTEINNKLDDMAESGELSEIISQYLNSNSIRSYDNITDLQAGQNLAEGAFAKTFGKITIDDGYGAFYHIRQITNDDVVDNYNIVALTNYPTLIAEKIKSYNTKDFVLFAFFDDNNDDVINFFVSEDNVHLRQIKVENKIYGRDPSIVYYNNKFYVAVTDWYDENHDFKIYESSDLENWTEHIINVGLYDETYQKTWAPDFFVDSNNDLYVFLSKQYANTEGEGDFKIYKTKCTNINTLTFSEASLINLSGDTSNNHIDATVIKINDTYHMIVKNETQTALYLEHYTSADLTNFTLQDKDFANFGTYMEGAFVYKFNDEFYVGAEKYGYNNTSGSSYRIKKSKDFENFSNYEKMYITDLDLSHGNACVIDNNNAKNILSNKKAYGFEYNHNFEVNKKENYLITYTSNSQSVPTATYLKLFSIKPKIEWKTGSISFNICDSDSFQFNSNIQLSYRVGSLSEFSVPLLNSIQTYANIQDASNYKKSNLHGKLLTIPNETDKTIDIFLDTTVYDNVIVMLDFLSINTYTDEIIVYSDTWTNELPTETNISYIKHPYRTKSAYPLLYSTNIDNGTNSNLRIKLCMSNGSFSVYGHGLTANLAYTIDYQINVLNGSIVAINKVSGNTNINMSFSVASYSNGIYTIEITGIPNYSGFNILLPPDINSSLLDAEFYTIT